MIQPVNLRSEHRGILKAMVEQTVPLKLFDKTLEKEGLVNDDGKLTGKGLAVAVGYCDASMNKYLETHPNEKHHWSDMLRNIGSYLNTKEEYDIYFRAMMQSFLEHDYFKPNGWFKDRSSLSMAEVLSRRRSIVQNFMELCKTPNKFAKEILEMQKVEAERQLKEMGAS